jgi:hypothetical protein
MERKKHRKVHSCSAFNSGEDGVAGTDVVAALVAVTGKI